MSKRYLITGTIVVATAAITLSGCTSSGSSAAHSSMSGGSSTSGSAAVQAGPPAIGPHNAADVSFATDMIPHHAQALEMAKMVLTQAHGPKVKQLAQMIENEQTPEISAMSGWLKGWNKPVPDNSTGGMHMGGADMPGMMSDSDMAKLGSATGATFDKLFLTQMVTHHTGAVTMANTELSAGQNADAKTLAKSIIGQAFVRNSRHLLEAVRVRWKAIAAAPLSGQSKEITQMKTLLPTIK